MIYNEDSRLGAIDILIKAESRLLGAIDKLIKGDQEEKPKPISQWNIDTISSIRKRNQTNPGSVT
jgi:hypothetical protein